MLENDPPNWKRWNKLWIGDLETDRPMLIERSPITYVENVRCPLLVIQGDNDPRIPREESARRENQILMFQRMTAFLERHLLA
jgi:dipeptidyl aminopeptidase/acylaminoacyl peptidase